MKLGAWVIAKRIKASMDAEQEVQLQRRRTHWKGRESYQPPPLYFYLVCGPQSPHLGSPPPLQAILQLPSWRQVFMGNRPSDPYFDCFQSGHYQANCPFGK